MTKNDTLAHAPSAFSSLSFGVSTQQKFPHSQRLDWRWKLSPSWWNKETTKVSQPFYLLTNYLIKHNPLKESIFLFTGPTFLYQVLDYTNLTFSSWEHWVWVCISITHNSSIGQLATLVLGLFCYILTSFIFGGAAQRLKNSYMQSSECPILENNFICMCEIPSEALPLKAIEVWVLRTSYKLSYPVV